ncbi:RNA-directed DNA methylation 4-like protein [Drosera capensis]
MDGSTLHYDPDIGGESSSSPVPVDKPVIVRVKRKTSQSPLDVLWLEISERPSKHPLVDFEKLSISPNSSSGKVDLIKRVLVQHVQTVDSSEAAMDVLRSLAQPGGDNGTKVSSTANTLKNASKQHQLLAKAKQEQAARQRCILREGATENHPLNDYPDEESGSEDEDDEASGNESEEHKSENHSSKESSIADDDSEDRDDFSLWKDPLEEDSL